MYVRFTDRRGERGVVTPELRLEYDGRWEDRIEAAVLEVVAEFDRANDAYDREDLFLELVVRLPELSVLSRVRLEESAEGAG